MRIRRSNGCCRGLDFVAKRVVVVVRKEQQDPTTLLSTQRQLKLERKVRNEHALCFVSDRTEKYRSAFGRRRPRIRWNMSSERRDHNTKKKKKKKKDERPINFGLFSFIPSHQLSPTPPAKLPTLPYTSSSTLSNRITTSITPRLSTSNHRERNIRVVLDRINLGLEAWCGPKQSSAGAGQQKSPSPAS